MDIFWQVIGYHDTDIAEFLFKGAVQVDDLSKFLCKDLSKACLGKIPSVPKVYLQSSKAETGVGPV